MFEVGVVAGFEAAHRLRGNFGPAARTHEHTYRVEVAVRGPELSAEGTLCDLSLLQRAVQDAVSELHERDLDNLPALRGRNTTAEVVARHLFERVTPALRGLGLETCSVRVWESPSAFAAYEEGVG